MEYPLVARVRLDEARQCFLARSPSAATRKTYAADLRHFFRFLGALDGVPTLDEVRRVSWREVIAYRDRFFVPDPVMKRSALSPDTGARRLAVLHAFFEELRKAGIVAESPARDVPRPRASTEGKTPGLRPEDVNRLLASCEKGTQRGERDLLLLAVMFFQWLRVAEAVRLRVEDLGENAGVPTLRVWQKGGRERILALREEVSDRARAYIEKFEITGFLFPALSPGVTEDRPLGTEAARLIFKKACVRAGLDPRAYSPHSARVSGITAALSASVPLDVVQDFAGHARPETTLRYHRARRRLDRAPVASLPFRLP
ncbi:MAG: tyrosine-type recombinase/integrase [Planctomycetota bacterium]